MAGYYEDEAYAGPHRAAQFDTMNLGEPHRAAPFDTVNLGAAPHRAAQFETMNLGAPVRGEAPNKGGEEAGYYPPTSAPTSGYGGGGGSGHTPMNPALETQSKARGDSNGGVMHKGLVIADLVLRSAATVSLIISIAVLASNSQVLDGSDVSFTSLSSTKYALAVAIIGAVYSIYEVVSAAVRLGMGHPLLPGKLSLFVSYIGDQVVIVLLLTGASAGAATFKDLSSLAYDLDGNSYCSVLNDFCKQGAGAVAMIFIGFCFIAPSLVISSFCFYKNKI
eukprot:c15501_g1_i1 orf=34-867(+)